VKAKRILATLEQMFPDAECELNYESVFQLLVAVVLSAQTTDIAVNKVTVDLFDKFDSADKLAEAPIEEVESILKKLGLYHNKSKNIISLSKQLIDKFDGVVPNNMEDLITLDGVGRKTANVVLGEYYNIPSIAVDTHVERVTKRLGLVKDNASVLEVEKTLMKKYPKNIWVKLHHQLIFFGRYHCKAKKPNCEECLLVKDCNYYKKKS